MELKSIVIVCAALASLAACVRVETPYGAVDGVSGDGSEYFKGIPYAEAPTGSNRFRMPQAKKPWSHPLDASAFRPGCAAPCPRGECPVMSEDCLFLNVYRPANIGNKALPVLVYIPGGSFLVGSASHIMYDGSNLAKEQQIIVVTLNYRLGILGGLFTDAVPHNLQIQDQREALRFVKRAIGAFGGDPARVTLSGQSAGASSVIVHLTSEASRGLFDAAIVMSDPAGMMFPLASMARQNSKRALSLLGCPHGGEAELRCLQQKPLPDLMKCDHSYFGTRDVLMNFMPWAPVVDGQDIVSQPIELLENGLFNKVPVLMGTTANESVTFVYDGVPTPVSSVFLPLVLEVFLGRIVGRRTIAFYGPVPSNESSDGRHRVSVIGTDYLFYCASQFMMTMMSKSVKVFGYLFDKPNSWFARYSRPKKCRQDVCHGSDVPYVFHPYSSLHFKRHVPEAELELIKTIQTMWGNFVHHHDPGTVANGVTMQPFSASANNLVNLSTPSSPLDGYRNAFCDFWDREGYVRY